MSLIHNERLKLLATYINGLAVALFAVGGLAPIFQVSGIVSVVSVVCFLVSAAPHYAGSLILRGLKS